MISPICAYLTVTNFWLWIMTDFDDSCLMTMTNTVSCCLSVIIVLSRKHRVLLTLCRSGVRLLRGFTSDAFSARNLRTPSADSCETFPHNRKWVQLENAVPKFGGLPKQLAVGQWEGSNSFCLFQREFSEYDISAISGCCRPKFIHVQDIIPGTGVHQQFFNNENSKNGQKSVF